MKIFADSTKLVSVSSRVNVKKDTTMKYVEQKIVLQAYALSGTQRIAEPIQMMVFANIKKTVPICIQKD